MTSTVGKCGAETFNLISTRGFRIRAPILVNKPQISISVLFSDMAANSHLHISNGHLELFIERPKQLYDLAKLTSPYSYGQMGCLSTQL